MGNPSPGIFLFRGESRAQQYALGESLTAEELKAKVTADQPLRIAIQGVHPNVWQNGYFYNDGSVNGTHAYSSSDCVWLLEKISGATEDLYYLRHAGTEETSNYIQKDDPKHLGAVSTAAQFRIVFPTTSGSGETKWGKTRIWSGAAEDHLVRFVPTNNSGATWFRFGGGTDVTYVSGNGDYTVMLVYELKASVNVTFRIYDENNQLLGTDVKNMAPGATVSYTLPSYVSITSKSYDDAATVPENGGTYDIHTHANLPFMVSSNTGEDANWTLLKIRSTLWLFGSEDNLVHTESVEPTSSTLDAYQWCITGDWLNGFVLTNKATGKHVANLGATNPEQSGWAAISLTDGDASADTHRFEYVADANGAFAFRIKGTSADYLSNTYGTQNKILCIYSAIDDGSRLRVTSTQQLATDMKNNWMFSRNSVGGYADADLAGLESVTDLASAYAFNEGLADKSTIAFDASKYYRIKNYSRDLSLGFNHTEAGNGAFIATNKADAGAGINAHGQSLSEAAALWQFIGDGTNGYKIYNLNAKKYVGKTASSNSVYLTLTDNADEAGIYTLTLWSGATGQYKIACTNGEGGSQQLHVSGAGVMNYNGGVNDPSAWYLQPAETFEVNLSSVGESHWSSLYLPFAVDVPDDAIFYVASSKGDDCVNLTPVEGTLPAEQGVVVKSDAQSKLALTVVPDAESADKQSNVFEGTLEAQTITTDERASYYVLGASEGSVGLYHPSATTLKANRAYIPATSMTSPQLLRFVFGKNDVTGIDQIHGENVANVYYDLTGRRVNNPRHGIYISNQKKVFIP